LPSATRAPTVLPARWIWATLPILELCKTSDARTEGRLRARPTGSEAVRCHGPAVWPRKSARPPHRPGDLLQRQPACACGQTCPRCAGGAQLHAKLAVSCPDDEFEREADRVADAVLRMPATETAMMSRGNAGATDRDEVRRAARPDRPGAAGGTGTVSLGHGEPLPAAERAFFEARFGEDFSTVRLHVDATAGAAALGFDARAFTLGRDIAFAPGEYAPGTAEESGSWPTSWCMSSSRPIGPRPQRSCTRPMADATASSSRATTPRQPSIAAGPMRFG